MIGDKIVSTNSVYCNATKQQAKITEVDRQFGRGKQAKIRMLIYECTPSCGLDTCKCNGGKSELWKEVK